VNVLLTLLIAGRLLWMSGRVNRALGKHHARKYTSIAAMLVECALPYSAVGLAFIVAYAIGHPLEEPLIAALSQLVVRSNPTYTVPTSLITHQQCITPELIIWRVATGRAWAGNTGAFISQVSSRTTGVSSMIASSELRFKTTETDTISPNKSRQL
jgi:uncharacterized iron-regulated membrane protein